MKLNPRQAQALTDEVNRIASNLSRAWAALYAKAAVAKASAKADLDKVKASLDVLAASKAQVISGALAPEAWGESAKAIAFELQRLAVGLAEPTLAERLREMNPTSDLKLALEGPSMWPLLGAAMAAVFLLPKLLGRRRTLSEWEPENELDDLNL